MTKGKKLGDTRMDLAHVATTMYSERVKDDTEANRADIYERNPDARQLYFKGIQDTLLCLETWSNMGVSKAVMTQFIAALVEQTKGDAQAH